MLFDPIICKVKKMLESMQGSGFDTATDSLEAIRNNTGIKLVQRGIVTLTVATTNVTITAVDMEKAFLNFNQRFSTTNDDVSEAISRLLVRGRITTTTNIEFTRAGAADTNYVAWEVIEWK